MNFIDYQFETLRTKGKLNKTESLLMGGLGIAGESGEVADYIKKIIFHGHQLDSLKIAEELGDVLWYISILANDVGFTLEGIAEMNIDKLRDRYPDGFSSEKSINRK